MDTDNLEVEQLQQYLDKARNEVRSDIKMYKSQLEKNYLDFLTGMRMTCTKPVIWITNIG